MNEDYSEILASLNISYDFSREKSYFKKESWI